MKSLIDFFDYHYSIDLSKIRLEQVRPKDVHLWNKIIDKYHYQGYTGTVGRYIRYWITDNMKLIGLISAGSCSLLNRARKEILEDVSLNSIANNWRFLLLYRHKNLATTVLSRFVKKLKDDWKKKYGDNLVAIETFVDKTRFNGTCYKAAGWDLIGETQGFARSGSMRTKKVSFKETTKKYIFLKILDKKLRRKIRRMKNAKEI